MTELGLAPRGYRRITPLGMSTLLWLNADSCQSARDSAAVAGAAAGATRPRHTAVAGVGGSTGGGVAAEVADTEGADTEARISQAVLDAALAVDRYYTAPHRAKGPT